MCRTRNFISLISGAWRADTGDVRSMSFGCEVSGKGHRISRKNRAQKSTNGGSRRPLNVQIEWYLHSNKHRFNSQFLILGGMISAAFYA